MSPNPNTAQADGSASQANPDQHSSVPITSTNPNQQLDGASTNNGAPAKGYKKWLSSGFKRPRHGDRNPAGKGIEPVHTPSNPSVPSMREKSTDAGDHDNPESFAGSDTGNSTTRQEDHGFAAGSAQNPGSLATTEPAARNPVGGRLNKTETEKKFEKMENTLKEMTEYLHEGIGTLLTSMVDSQIPDSEIINGYNHLFYLIGDWSLQFAGQDEGTQVIKVPLNIHTDSLSRLPWKEVTSQCADLAGLQENLNHQDSRLSFARGLVARILYNEVFRFNNMEEYAEGQSTGPTPKVDITPEPGANIHTQFYQLEQSIAQLTVTGHITHENYNDWRAVSTTLLSQIHPAQLQDSVSQAEPAPNAKEPPVQISDSPKKPNDADPEPFNSNQGLLAAQPPQTRTPPEKLYAANQQLGGDSGILVADQSEQTPKDALALNCSDDSQPTGPDTANDNTMQSQASQQNGTLEAGSDQTPERGTEDQRSQHSGQDEIVKDQQLEHEVSDDAYRNAGVLVQEPAKHDEPEQNSKNEDKKAEVLERPGLMAEAPVEKDHPRESPAMNGILYQLQPERLKGLMKEASALLGPWSREADSNNSYKELEEIVRYAVEFAELLRRQRAYWSLVLPAPGSKQEEGGHGIWVQPELNKRGTQRGAEGFQEKQTVIHASKV
ncbi:hypothetical protein QBC44DRAFT_316486 [Cladorrhinum sp. PSN332]|nr:hypothetical protein QBC44DRAFT_316486 [Cladorrhinum sp. PSN332]